MSYKLLQNVNLYSKYLLKKLNYSHIFKARRPCPEQECPGFDYRCQQNLLSIYSSNGLNYTLIEI